MEPSTIIFSVLAGFVFGFLVGRRVEKIRIRNKYGEFYHDDFEGYGYTDIDSELSDD